MKIIQLLKITLIHLENEFVLSKQRHYGTAVNLLVKTTFEIILLYLH